MRDLLSVVLPWLFIVVAIGWTAMRVVAGLEIADAWLRGDLRTRSERRAHRAAVRARRRVISGAKAASYSTRQVVGAPGRSPR